MPLSVLGLLLLAAQVAGARVEGFVLDAATGAPLAGATVSLEEAGVAVASGPDGRYVLPAPAPGPQHLTVRRLGYAPRTVHLLVPRTGTLEMTVALEARPIAVPSLLVSAAPPVRGVDPADSTAFPDRGVSASALRAHPTLAHPDALRVLSGGEVVVEPEAAGGVHVRGGAADHTAFALDGIPVFNPYHAAGLYGAWNPDALGRVRLLAAAPSPGLPSGLSGVVAAETRAVGERLRVETALTTADGRVTVAGPAGPARLLVSARAGLSSALAPHEPSYLSPETGDLLATLEVDAPGGRLRILRWESENELGAVARVVEEGPSPAAARHRFAWSSRSTGATWSGGVGGLAVRASAWRADTRAGATWSPAEGPAEAASSRTDHGVDLSVERRAPGATTGAGLRLRDVATAYRVEGAPRPAWSADGSVGVATVWVEHARELGGGLGVRATATASRSAGTLRLAPQVEARWRAGPGLEWSLAGGRSLQFAQSVRNPESVAGLVFPADLFVAAGVAGVPVPRADQVVAAGSWRPAAGVRVAGQAYARRLEGVLLVAPGEDGPFATGPPRAGRASVRGAALDVSARGARYGVVLGYGTQRVRFGAGGAAWVPRHGAAHLLEAGVAAYPSATASLRASVLAAGGRRATALAGAFEWEACNVLDQGCEFAGAPRAEGPPGGSTLPVYLRLDLGGRKHWHLRVGARDAVIGLSATVANVVGRGNVLAWVVDPDGGGREPVEMLPRAPLVVGVDVRF